MSKQIQTRTNARARHTIAGLPNLTALSLGLMLALPAMAQQQAEATTDPSARTLDTVTVTGSRVQGRTAEETAAPVDVIGHEELSNTGAMELGQALQLLEPSFNFSRTTVSDGTDILRPATLRALGPDQVLVLINGKRRHQQALVNVQQTIARGSAGTDINAIPVSAVDRIEVLRDGAAAQYEQALKLKPDHVPSLYRLGIVYTKLKQFEPAAAVWRKYIKATNDDAGGYSNLGFCYEMAGDAASAE